MLMVIHLYKTVKETNKYDQNNKSPIIILFIFFIFFFLTYTVGKKFN